MARRNKYIRRRKIHVLAFERTAWETGTARDLVIMGDLEAAAQALVRYAEARAGITREPRTAPEGHRGWYTKVILYKWDAWEKPERVQSWALDNGWTQTRP